MSGERIFTTWFTSISDALDHAVTDEEFTTRRPTPEAVCGAIVVLAPLVVPPGVHCPRCTTFLRARAALRDYDQRERHRHRRPCLLARLLRRLIPGVSVFPAAAPTGRNPEVPQ